jgi:tyrosinase
MASSPPAVYIRQNVDSLHSDDPIVAAYRKGVTAMQRRSQANQNDPLGWTYQANMHGSYTKPALPLWNGCQHGTYFFLSWHRMYIWYFERIVRAASAYDDFALPYWDWTRDRALPEIFRLPAESANPLYVQQRRKTINDGVPMDQRVVVTTPTFSYTDFSSPPGSGLSFGGQAQGPIHLASNPIFGQFENQPHNNVHDVVGGTTGWMSDPNMAARDPIFWLHHANVDRLWKRWLDLGDGRSNPTGDAYWMTYPFSFFDANGKQVTLTGADILDTVAQLDYLYYDEWFAASRAAPPPSSGDEPAAAAAAAPAPVHLGASAGSVTLGSAPSRVDVPVEDPEPSPPSFTADADAGTEAAASARRRAGGRTVVRLEGVRSEWNPGLGYAVYVSVPGAEGGGAAERYYAGNISFFGIGQHPNSLATGEGGVVAHQAGAEAHDHGGHAAHDDGGGHDHAAHGGHGHDEGGHPVHAAADIHLEITPLVERLRAAGQWNPDRVTVEFEPISVEGGDDEALLVGAEPGAVAAGAVPQPNPSIDLVRITRE